MFKKLLIANRGEIACRIIRTARRLGLRTVAVYSDADAHALHVAQADEAHRIGPAPARDSYLNIHALLEAARASGADAVHPGYGFLSENADFADAIATAGLAFIGPPPAAIRAMGSKSAAKSLMERAAVPLVPGYHGDDQDPARLAAHAERIGYPVLIKASAGGGGKGMRVVEHARDFLPALDLASGEALAAFGDGKVLIERYLQRPRHIEIQVFADRAGKIVHLFERDCSVQRRHQKILEEAPAPGMTEATRAAMGEAACAAARAIGYEGAGTVEFIAEADAFYFMEMNTRLQVEHPVTEMITGLDLVEWQLRVAAGDPLPLDQSQLSIRGHAIEARLYAEDPSQDDRPSIGRLAHLRFPPETETTRIDTGVRAGDVITIHYDPMIAKLIAHGATRADALAHLRAALAATEIAGPQTNLPLLRAIAAHPDYAAGGVDTSFLARHPDLRHRPAEPPFDAIAAAALTLLADHAARAADRAATRHDAHSPWSSATAWRLNGDGYLDLALRHGDRDHAIRLHPAADGSCRLEGRTIARTADTLTVDGARRRLASARDANRLIILLDGDAWNFLLPDPLGSVSQDETGADRLLAPMPGRIVSLHAQPGDHVTKGDLLLVLEAMKVQMRLTAPRDATVAEFTAGPGEMVDEGVELVTFTVS